MTRLTLSTVAATTALALLQGLYFPAADAVGPLAICLGLAAVALFYAYLRPAPAFVTCLTALVVLVAFSTVFALLTYAIAANHRPWADPLLARCDAALGLSAEQLIHWVDARPWLALALKAAYFSIIPQTILAIVYLGWTNRREVLERFLVRFMLCGLVTAVLFYFLPAQGTCASYNVSTPDYYQPILDHLHALRSGARTLITWREAEGLITFPSFHAIWGVLLTAGFYRTRLFIPVALLNAVMIVSTVPVGMHYFTDVLAGLTISLAAIVLVRRV